jgi:DNA-binding response OmpR family regulator
LPPIPRAIGDPAPDDFVVESLRMDGYSVIEARNGAEGLEAVNRSLTPIDLMITDVVMRGMQGKELAKRVNAARPSLKVLFMTGYDSSDDMRRGSFQTVRVPLLPVAARKHWL